MKPIEDIKAAVIAEYARFKTIMYCVPLENGMFAHQHSLLCISWNSFGAYNDFISVDPKGHSEEAKWRAIHQLLGLSERDAVEAERAFWQGLAEEQKKVDGELAMFYAEAEVKWIRTDADNRKLLEAAKAVISESEKEYAVTTMSEVAMLSDGFEQAIANLDAVLSELEKGGAGE